MHRWCVKKIKGVLYNYNCWGWAIQKITGKFKACNPSGFDNAIAKQGNVGILADWTKNSIEELGATADVLGELNDVQLNDEMNNLQDNQYMVAMRLGMYGAYHYMRYDNGVWTHKWGNSGNLWQLNEITPNNEDAWTTYEIDPKSTGKVRIVTGLNGEPFRPYKNSRTWYIKVTLPKKTFHCVIT